MTSHPDAAPVAADIPPEPSTPARLTAWALAWAFVAAAGGVVLATAGADALDWSMSGQRTEGIVLFTPILASAVAVFLGVRAVLAVGKTRAYRAAYTEQMRAHARHARNAQQHPGFFVVIAAVAGVLWLAGTIAVVVFFSSLRSNPAGLALAIMLLGLLAMAWVPALAAAITAAKARNAAR